MNKTTASVFTRTLMASHASSVGFNVELDYGLLTVTLLRSSLHAWVLVLYTCGHGNDWITWNQWFWGVYILYVTQTADKMFRHHSRLGVGGLSISGNMWSTLSPLQHSGLFMCITQPLIVLFNMICVVEKWAICKSNRISHRSEHKGS